MKKVYKKARRLLKKGEPETTIRALFVSSALAIADADQFLFREKTKTIYGYVKWTRMLFVTYLWACALYLLVAATDFSVQQQSVNLATFAAVLFVVSLLFRPKPAAQRVRTAFTTLELAFPGALIALTGILMRHPGWQAPSIPDGGAFASTLWPFLWVGAWLGPAVLAALVFVIAHYAVINIRTSFFIHRQALLLKVRQQALRSHYKEAVLQAAFVPESYVDNLVVKTVKLLTTNSEWNPKSTVEIYALGEQFHVKPLGGGGALLTASPLVAASEEGDERQLTVSALPLFH